MKFILVATAFLISNIAFAQNSKTGSSSEGSVNTRFIQVNGQAEKELSPDIIYFSVTLREYLNEGYQGGKVSIDDLEKNFLRALFDAGIASSDISIESISGYTDWALKKKSPAMLASKRYLLKLNDLDKITALMRKVDSKAVFNAYVSGYDYTKIEEVKKELRIEALKNAQVKADYMLAALNERVGAVLTVMEQERGSRQDNVSLSAKVLEGGRASDPGTNIEFRKIKVSSSVRVKFLIK